MSNKDNEELFNNLYMLSNNNQKKKLELIKDKKKQNSKANNNFQKITGSGSINTSGSNPIVVFKKNSIKKGQGDITQLNSKNIAQKSKNEYISDGGLSKKIQKFNNNIQNNNAHNIYFNNYINEKNQQLPNNKNIKNNADNTNSNNITKKNKQILSKTVREFNKRPAIAKTEKSKEFGSAKNNIDLKKFKNKSVNQNLNNNNSIKNNQKNKKINNEDSKVQEEKKITIMKQLVENGVVNEIKKLNNKKKSITQKERNEERKREILESHGLPIDLSDDEEEEKNDSKKSINNKSNEEKQKSLENNNINNLNKKFLSKTTRGFYPKIHSYMFSQEDNHNFNSEDKSNPLRAKKLKPSVNNLEYIVKINNEKRKLNFNSDIMAPQTHFNINHSTNIFQKRKLKSVNNELNDSFRHQNVEKYKGNNINFNKNIKLKSKSYNNEILRKSIDDFKDEFPFAHKKNHRTSEELKKFVKEKRIKNKKKEDDILLEKNKKLFLLFKNLYNLNMKDFSKASPSATSQYFYIKSPHTPNFSNRGKAVMPSKNNINYLNKNKNEQNNNNIRKKKEINEYYIGNESTIKNNNSTLVDPNEYYLNVLESQQLFVNSGLNKIENDSEASDENNNTNDLNISKEQIQKIISKESKKNSSNKKNNNLILNTNEYDSLKKRIDNTLKRAGKMFSNKDKENETTEDNKEKIDIPKISEKNGKEEEKEKIKNNNAMANNKSNNKSPKINIESSNVEQQKLTNNNTKEKNLPSLSHTYSTNSNPNKKVEVEIEPRAVLNLVEILKFIIQRKVFVLLYESYINRAIYQQYNIAFAYFVAVCKQYPFRKLEEFCNYKTYKYAFRHLFKPFLRKAFRMFIKSVYTNKKVQYLVLLLDRLIKNKIFTKLINYANFIEINSKLNKQKINIFIKYLENLYLKKYYLDFKNKILLEKQIKNKNDNINIADDKFKKIDKKDILKNNDINKNEDSLNLSDYANHRRKNDNSEKMNSYLYESFGSESKSLLSIEPNSEDNDRLHQLKMMILIKNNYRNYDDNDSNSESFNNSLGKIIAKKKLGEQIKPKINISDDEDLKIKDNKIIDINNEKNNSIEIDISADNDKSNEIEWGYNINTINSKKDKEENDDKNKKNKKPLENEDFNDDDYNDFEKDNNIINEKKEKEKILKKENKITEIDNKIEINKEEKKEEEKKDLNILKNEIKQDKSRNLKESPEIKNECKNIKEDNKEKKSEIKEIKEDIKISDKEEVKINNSEIKEKEKKEKKEKEEKEKEEKRREIFSKKIKEISNPEKFANELAKEILDKILTSEIKSSKKKLTPAKKFKFDKFDKMNSQSNSLNNSFGSAGNTHDHLSKEFGLSGLSQLSLADELLSLNDSIMSNYSAHSVFNKTIKDKKKERTLNLYFNNIAPKLIRMIRKEIIDKYPLIYENISTPMKNNSEKLMMSLALQDAELLRDNYKTTKDLVSIAKILDKEKILKNFEAINKKIRNNDNVTSDNFYDKMLNDCIVETAIEIINKERLYGKNGEPLKWSSRTHELAFKYKKNEPEKLANYVCKKLCLAIKRKVGLITDNYEEMSPEQINFERDKRLTGIIKRDLDEYEYQWNNLEMEETQLKVDNAEAIMDQLYNEVIEILEHIQYSRIRPDLYQNKSIYACEEIPKLDFQLTTTEDATLAEGNDNNNNNDIINV